MKLTICTQHLMDEPVPIGADKVCFTDLAGRTALEVSVIDGGGIVVRGAATDVRIDGVPYSERLSIRPRVSNSVEIFLLPREGA